MDINSILGELRAERDRINRAIAAIEGLDSTGRRRAGRPPKGAQKAHTRGRMSASGRRKLSRLMKQRWAQGKMKARAKAKLVEPSKPAGRVSAAGRKRIAEAAKRRWAEWRKRTKAT